MREENAPGLTVDWVNAWLAALGVTVLVPEVSLRWTGEAVPSACFRMPDHSPPLRELLAGALPSLDDLGRLSIARWREDTPELSRKVSLDVYARRAAVARRSADTSLSSTVTDLLAELPNDGLPHSPFDPPMPHGITLWERVISCRKAIDDVEAAATETFAGRGRRVANNGLGFDARRLVGGVRSGEPRVDPLIEMLAFCGLALFPLRGNGTESQARGWTGPGGRSGSFRWCAWSPALDRWAIDALLDVVALGRSGVGVGLATRLGITASYRSIPYQSRGSADPTRAYGAERQL